MWQVVELVRVERRIETVSEMFGVPERWNESSILLLRGSCLETLDRMTRWTFEESEKDRPA